MTASRWVSCAPSSAQTLLDQTAIGLSLELGEQRADAGFVACRQLWSRGVDERDHRAFVLVEEVDLARRVEAGGGWDANREVDGRLGFVEGDRAAKQQRRSDLGRLRRGDLVDPPDQHASQTEAVGDRVSRLREEHEPAGDGDQEEGRDEPELPVALQPCCPGTPLIPGPSPRRSGEKGDACRVCR